MRRSCLFLAFLGLTVAQPSTTISKEAATTTSSTAFSLDSAPAEGTFVDCGGHFAGTCEDCHPTWPTWCNGDCSWEDNQCGTPHISSAENKTTNSKVPANGIAGHVTERPVGDASKTGSSSGGVSCGGHTADTCRQCHSTKKSWCNKDCKWIDGFACVYKYLGGYANEVLGATNQHRRSNGKRSLRLDSTLTASAQDWARQLADSCQFVHRPKPWPSSARNENIAGQCEWFPPGSEVVFDNWKNSAGHNKAMLKDSHRIMGVGMAQKRGCAKFCWTSGNQAEKDGAVVVAMYG
jgi:hypothetical protein